MHWNCYKKKTYKIWNNFKLYQKYEKVHILKVLRSKVKILGKFLKILRGHVSVRFRNSAWRILNLHHWFKSYGDFARQDK